MKLCFYPSVTENVESNDHCDDAGVVVVVVDNDQISLIVSYIFLYNIRFSGALYSVQYAFKTTANSCQAYT